MRPETELFSYSPSRLRRLTCILLGGHDWTDWRKAEGNPQYYTLVMGRPNVVPPRLPGQTGEVGSGVEFTACRHCEARRERGVPTPGR